MIKRSISGRLVLMFVLASVLIATASAFVLRSSLHESLQKQMHNELQFRESLMGPWIFNRTTVDDWPVLETKFTDLSISEGGRVQYWVLSDNPQFRLGGPPPPGVKWSELKDGFSKVAGATEENCSLFLLITEIPARGERPAVRHVVAIDSTPYIGTLNEFTRTMVILMLAGVLLVALLGFIISRIGMRPVNHLSEQAHKLAPGDHGKRLDTRYLPDELQKLAAAFNGVLERQEVAWHQLESFNADVAHELKTPLTNLIGQTQLGLSRKRQAQELEELLESNLEELERMTSIVNDMLFLSHAQAGKHATQLTEVSLHEEARKTAEYVEPSFVEKNLTVDINGDAIVKIDHRLFHRSLANLLENSARYAAADSTVTVTISKNEQQVSVAVSNIGEPIADEHLTRLFERFYRIDSSRTQSDTHHGLGLSIVKAVAIMHRGDVFASSKAGINTFGLTMAI